MESAKFNESGSGPNYSSTGYIDEARRLVQGEGSLGMSRKCDLGVVFEGGQPGGRDPLGVLLRGAIGEFIGMVLFLFYGVTAVRFIQDRNDIGETSASTLNIALAFGLSIFILVYVLADASGANLNPAVSIGLLVGKRITVERFSLYVVAQCLGATIGASIANIFLDHSGGAFNALAPGVSMIDALIGEIMCTFLLVITVLAATDGELGRKLGHTGPLLPLVIGFSVVLAHLVLVPVDGCSINPARSFATAFTNGYWNDQWIFWCGPLVGGVLAAAAWEVALRPEQPNEAAK